MINKTEKEIMKNWPIGQKNPDVTIKCAAYNQEKFISKTLDSFLMQETNFPFEIVVHDDASSDSTVAIIKEYELKFPNIINAIYEKNNIYSRYDGSIEKIFANATRGKYFAICEGDDYWTDKNKLQLQYDILERNPKCVLCVHNTIINDLLKNTADSYFSNCKTIKKLTAEDVFLGWNVHTSSYFVRSSFYTKIFDFPNYEKFWFGDFVLLCLALYHGEITYLPQIMSAYNKNNIRGVTYVKEHVSDGKLYENEKIKIEFLETYNKYTSYIFNELILKVIKYHQLLKLYFKGDCKEILRNRRFHDTLTNLPFSMRTRVYLKAYFPKMFLFIKNKLN